MDKKEMIDDLKLIEDQLNKNVKMEIDCPLWHAVDRLRNCIYLLSPGSFVDKVNIFEIIDRIFDHYKSAVLAYTDILANYNEKCTVEITDGYIETAKGLFMKIQDSVKSAISDYYNKL